MKMKWLDEYQCWVFDDGRVATPSKSGLKYRKFHTDKHGYARCRVHNKHSILVHRLLAQAFILNPENKPTVDHIDRNPINNSIENLRWATYKEQADNRACVDACVEKYGVRTCDDKKMYDSAHSKAYYQSHKAEIKVKHERYRAEHINEYREYQRNWHRTRRASRKGVSDV